MRYVDDTICFVCNGYQEFALSCLNSYHNSIQFIYEVEKENEISFLDILIICSGHRLRHVFIKNLQIQTYTFIGIHMLHLHGNLAH